MAENQPKSESGKKKTGLYIIGAALVLLVLGYFVLTKVNADASNWAGAVAPIMIIGGYITVAVGILVGWDE
jgi:cytochrome c biogenesis protein CcdA